MSLRLALPAAIIANVAAAQTASYRILDLEELAAPHGVVQCEARGINNQGVIAGFEVLPEFLARAIVWRGYEVDFPPTLPGDNASYAWAVAADGRVLGESQFVTVEYIGHQIRITIEGKAVSWTGSTVVDLNTTVTGGANLHLDSALAVSPGGLIVGVGVVPGETARHGYPLDAAGIVTDLGILTDPTGVTDAGVVVGYGFNAGGTHALRFSEGVVSDLHRSPPLTGVTSRAWGINAAGQIAGEAQFHISQPEQPTLWNGDQIIRLVPEFVRPQGVATAINRHAQVAGFYINLDDLTDTFHGFLWQEGQRIDLLDHVDVLGGWQFVLPLGMNDRGQVVGGGLRNNELGHGFVLTPIIVGDVDGGADVDIQDLAFLLACFGAETPQPCADFDGDGDTDLADLALLLANFGLGG